MLFEVSCPNTESFGYHEQVHFFIEYHYTSRSSLLRVERKLNLRLVREAPANPTSVTLTYQLS